jgi:hypothetical protein
MRPISLTLVIALVGCASQPTPEPQRPPQRPVISVAPRPRVHAPEAAVSQETLAQRQLCEARDLWACILVGLAFERGDGAPADLPTAARYYHLACDHRIAEACALLVNLYGAGGPGVARDPAQVSRLEQLLCEDGHEIHCQPVVEDDVVDDAPVSDEP